MDSLSGSVTATRVGHLLTERRTRLIFWSILAAGAALRAAYFFQVRDAFLFQTPVADAASYDEWAREIAGGDWLGADRGVFTMSPGYSYFLAGLYVIFGPRVEAVALVQFVLGLVTGALLYRLGRAVFGLGPGLVAMACYLAYSPEIFFEGTLLKPALINVLNVLALCLAGSGVAGGFCAGALLGFSAHLRPTALLLIPIVCHWLWHRSRAARPAGRRALYPPAAACVGALLVLLPVAARNAAVGREPVLTTAHGGMNFYTGNSPHALGPYTPVPFARSDPRVEQGDFLAEARRRAGRDLSPGESSAFWYAEALAYIRDNPLAWSRLMLRKTIVFLNSYEEAINLDPAFFRERYASVLNGPLLTFGALLPMALVGIVFAPAHLLFLAYLAVYFLQGIVFFSVAEYRFPVVPVLCLYAGGAAGILARAWRTRSWRRLVTVAVCAGLFAALANFDFITHCFGLKHYLLANRANSYLILGVTAERKGLFQQAEEAYRQALAIMPLAPALTYLGHLRQRAGDLAEAQRLFERALSLQPASAEAYADLGGVMLARGKPGSAVGAFEHALRIAPGLRRAAEGLRAARAAIGGSPMNRR